MIEKSDSYVTRLINHIRNGLPDGELELAEQFARQFWSRTPEEDLSGHFVEDIAGATIECWRLFQNRDPAEIQILVMNPERERDGWQSRHTVVQIMAPNMPFMVDSVLMALSHDGLITHHLNNVVFAVDRDAQGRITRTTLERDHASRELFIYAEIDRVEEEDVGTLKERLEHTAVELEAIVSDFLSTTGGFGPIQQTPGQTQGTVTVTYDFVPIPEPSTALLLGLGLLGFAARARR